jgi:hypothetical protein
MSTWIPVKGGPASGNRRSQRVLLSLPVTVRTEDAPRDVSFKEETQTLVVNAHGALIALAGQVEKGQALHLTNRTTHEEQLCRVTYVGPISGGKAQIGVEFTTSSPDFWRISFPPEDWVAPEQAPANSKAASDREPKTAPPGKIGNR